MLAWKVCTAGFGKVSPCKGLSVPLWSDLNSNWSIYAYMNHANTDANTFKQRTCICINTYEYIRTQYVYQYKTYAHTHSTHMIHDYLRVYFNQRPRKSRPFFRNPPCRADRTMMASAPSSRERWTASALVIGNHPLGEWSTYHHDSLSKEV